MPYPTDYMMQNPNYVPYLAGKRQAGDEQAEIANLLERILLELAMNRFEWKNLPDSVSQRWIELQLATRALAVYFNDDVTGKPFAMAGAGTGAINPVGDYTQFMVWGNGAMFLNRTLDAKDCVPIWANYLRFPDLDIIRVYSRRIAIYDRTNEINAENARRTKFIGVHENGNLTAQNIDKKIRQGVAAIPVTRGLNITDMFEALDLGIDPDMLINLDIARGRQWTQALSLLGINTANQDKKERLVAAEVSGNNDEIENIRNIQLNSRQIAVEQINKKFKTNIEVDFKTDMNTPELTDQKTPKEAQGARTDEGDKK